MKHFLFPTVFFCLIACTSNTSTSTAKISTDSISPTPSSNTVSKPITIDSFILDNHEILAEKKMDFNSDGFEDVILVLKNIQEATISDYVNDNPSLRPLLFLAGDKEGSLQLVARNDKAVYCIDCGGQMGDPFNGIIVDQQFVSIEHYGGSQTRWSRVITFNYDKEKNSWFLYEDGTEIFEATTPEKGTNTNKQGSSTPFESFDIYQ